MWFKFEGKRYKVLKAKIRDDKDEPGTIISDELTIACGEGSIQIEEIQVEGKPKSNAKEFLLGHKNFFTGKKIIA